MYAVIQPAAVAAKQRGVRGQQFLRGKDLHLDALACEHNALFDRHHAGRMEAMSDVGHHHRHPPDLVRPACDEARRQLSGCRLHQAFGHFRNEPGGHVGDEVRPLRDRLQCGQPAIGHEGREPVRIGGLRRQDQGGGGVFVVGRATRSGEEGQAKNVGARIAFGQIRQQVAHRGAPVGVARFQPGGEQAVPALRALRLKQGSIECVAQQGHGQGVRPGRLRNGHVTAPRPAAAARVAYAGPAR